jgi:dCTP deaminase
MRMLIDRQIREALVTGLLTVEPSSGIESRIQPASLDVRLGDTFALFRTHTTALIDPKVDTGSLLEFTHLPSDGHLVLQPGEFVLAATMEKIGLGLSLGARVEGKSSLGRLGLLVHSTAGFIDPGWDHAAITLELSNVNRLPIVLYPGMPIAQLAFDEVAEVSSGYAGKYQGQHGPTPSRFHLNWTGSAWI